MSEQKSESFCPQVNASNEFLQIANDFGEPLEIVREALSNSYDSGATEFSFEVTIDSLTNKTIIEMRDNGSGMSYETLKTNFWDLGNSLTAKSTLEHIGEKGHGTKIYLRSDHVYVMTSDGESVSEATCLHPFEALAAGKMHEVKIESCELDEKLLPSGVGTYIKVIGYNNDDRTMFSQDRVEDYAYWFTKLGSFEGELPGKEIPDFSMSLKALDVDQPEHLEFGHRFPKENFDIDMLYDEFGEDAADNFAKRYVYTNQRLDKHPECKFDVVAYVEGNEAKRSYNKMLRQRVTAGSGRYKASDRYGIWLSKDFIPVERKNDWVSSFGTGSNSVIMLHGFINCQQLSLTANRGSVSNTNPELLEELHSRVADIISEINEDAYRVHGLKELDEITTAEHINKKEQEEYARRIKNVKTRKNYPPVGGVCLYEPSNESELFGIFALFYAANSSLFAFEPVDYVTSTGVDILARDKNGASPADTEYWYVELKLTLKKVTFNHSFKNIRYIVCWEIDDTIAEGQSFQSILGEERVLRVYPHNGGSIYRLEDPAGLSSTSIEVIQLKGMVEDSSSAGSLAGNSEKEL